MTAGLTSGPSAKQEGVKEEEDKSEYSYYSSEDAEHKEGDQKEEEVEETEREEARVREDKKAPVCEADLCRESGGLGAKEEKRTKREREEASSAPGLSTLPKKLSVGDEPTPRPRGQERPRSPLKKPRWDSHHGGRHESSCGGKDWRHPGGKDERAPLPRRPVVRPKPKSKGRKRRARGQAFKATKKREQQRRGQKW